MEIRRGSMTRLVLVKPGQAGSSYLEVGRLIRKQTEA